VFSRYGPSYLHPQDVDIALAVGGKDRCALSFDGVRFQGSAPPRSTIARYVRRSGGCKPFLTKLPPVPWFERGAVQFRLLRQFSAGCNKLH
jgi:hypothetical protein